MVATAIYSVTMVLSKENAFPLWRATERRWTKKFYQYYYYYYYYFKGYNFWTRRQKASLLPFASRDVLRGAGECTGKWTGERKAQ